MKVCSQCQKSRRITSFNWKNKSNGIRHSFCKFCHKQYRDAHYRLNKTKRCKQAALRRGKGQIQFQEWIIAYLLQHPCVDCGEPDIVVLDFDHQTNKSFTISRFVRNGANLERLIAEVAKCNVRCANCHRRKHAKENNNYRLRYQQSG